MGFFLTILATVVATFIFGGLYCLAFDNKLKSFFTKQFKKLELFRQRYNLIQELKKNLKDYPENEKFAITNKEVNNIIINFPNTDPIIETLNNLLLPLLSFCKKTIVVATITLIIIIAIELYDFLGMNSDGYTRYFKIFFFSIFSFALIYIFFIKRYWIKKQFERKIQIDINSINRP